MLDAARGIAGAGGLRRGKLIVAAVADEECLSIGAEALVRRWTADAAIVGEPTDLEVAIGHKGFEWVTIETTGVAAHGSRPEEGVDAIAMMGRVLVRLEAAGRTLPTHPRLGRASLHASLIEGGRELSTYPDRCTLQIERRTLPGEATGVAADEAEAILRALREEDPKFVASARRTFTRPAYVTPETCALPRLLGGAAGTVSFWTCDPRWGRHRIGRLRPRRGGAARRRRVRPRERCARVPRPARRRHPRVLRGVTAADHSASTRSRAGRAPSGVPPRPPRPSRGSAAGGNVRRDVPMRAPSRRDS